MGTQRDQIITGIRPEIKTLTDFDGELELFQNAILRPVLKFQNEIIIAQFRSYLKKFKPKFNAYNQLTQRNFIHDIMKQDPRIKNSLIASVVSLFTLEEYDYYGKHKNEVNKRLISMLISRIQTQLERLY